MSFSYYPVDPSKASFSEECLAADDPELAELRGLVARTRRRFVIVNGAVFVPALILDCSADGLPARQIAGGITLGMALGVLQAVLLLVTAWRHDRLSVRHCDIRAKVLRARAQTEHEGQAAAWRGHGGPADTTAWTGMAW
jgi:hypothetical protein